MKASRSLAAWLAERAEAFPPVADATVPGLSGDLSTVAGVGLAVRTARQLVQVSHAILATLVSHAGFRAVFIEGTDATGPALDRYVTTGVGDPAGLVAGSQSFLRMRETLELLRWLRSYAQDHPADPVRVVHDKPRGAAPASLEEIEERLARRDLHWHEQTGQQIVHLGGVAHTIVGDPRSVSPSPGPRHAHRNAGALMRQALGSRYTAVALSAGHGHVPFPLPEPDASFTESAFAGLDGGCLMLDLHADPDPSPEVRRWLARPLRMRCVGPGYDPGRDADFHVDAGPLGDCLDRLVHVRQVTPTTIIDTGKEAHGDP
jgi:erythromycin esterase